VHVSFQPAVSRAPILPLPKSETDTPIDVVGSRAKHLTKRRSEPGPLGRKPFQKPPIEDAFVAPNPPLDLAPCPAWEPATFGQFLEGFTKLLLVVKGDDDSGDPGLLRVAERSKSEDLVLIRTLAGQLRGRSTPQISRGLNDDFREGVTPYNSDESPMSEDLEDLFVWNELVRRDLERISIDLAKRVERLREAVNRDGEDTVVSNAEQRVLSNELLSLAKAVLGAKLALDLTNLFHSAIALRATDFPLGEVFDIPKIAWNGGRVLIPRIRSIWEKVILRHHSAAGLTRGKRPSLPPYWADEPWYRFQPHRWFPDALVDRRLLDDATTIEALDRLVEAAATNLARTLAEIQRIDRMMSTQYRREIVRWAVLAVQIILVVAGRRTPTRTRGPRTSPATASVVVSSTGYPATVLAARGGVVATRVLEALAAAGVVGQSSLAMFASSSDGQSGPRSSSRGGSSDKPSDVSSAGTEPLPPFNGKKTLGRFRGPDGKPVDLKSGWSGPAESVPRGTSGFDIVTRTHVEGHAAAIMRQESLREGTVFINNPRICVSCEKLLTKMLPSGSKLRVVLPDGSLRVFVGG